MEKLFDGSEDPESWLQSMEDYFEDFQISMEEEINTAIGFLRGAAANWAMENKLVISRNWCAFCYNLLWKFNPSTKPPEADDLMREEITEIAEETGQQGATVAMKIESLFELGGELSESESLGVSLDTISNNSSLDVRNVWQNEMGVKSQQVVTSSSTLRSWSLAHQLWDQMLERAICQDLRVPKCWVDYLCWLFEYSKKEEGVAIVGTIMSYKEYGIMLSSEVLEVENLRDIVGDTSWRNARLARGIPYLGSVACDSQQLVCTLYSGSMATPTCYCHVSCEWSSTIIVPQSWYHYDLGYSSTIFRQRCPSCCHPGINHPQKCISKYRFPCGSFCPNILHCNSSNQKYMPAHTGLSVAELGIEYLIEKLEDMKYVRQFYKLEGTIIVFLQLLRSSSQATNKAEEYSNSWFSLGVWLSESVILIRGHYIDCKCLQGFLLSCDSGAAKEKVWTAIRIS